MKKHTANFAIDMGDIIDDNIYSLSFGRQHRGLKELEVGKVGFDEGNDEGKFWVLPGEYDGQQYFSCSSIRFQHLYHEQNKAEGTPTHTVFPSQYLFKANLSRNSLAALYLKGNGIKPTIVILPSQEGAKI